jgi:RHS repeat-associated protein
VYRWYVYDGLGSVLAEVDSTGNVTATRKYDVYGAVRATSGTATSKHKYVGSLGHPSEDGTGLIYMRARYCDPISGRFISEDPAREGANWFKYANNSPVSFADRNGKTAEGVMNLLGLAFAAFDLFMRGGLDKSVAISMIMASIRSLRNY